MGLAITYGLKVNLHVCIVAMVNYTALAHSAKEEGGGGGCGKPAMENGTKSEAHPVEDVSGDVTEQFSIVHTYIGTLNKENKCVLTIFLSKLSSFVITSGS